MSNPKLSYAIPKGWGLHFSLATGLYYTKDSPKQVRHGHRRCAAQQPNLMAISLVYTI